MPPFEFPLEEGLAIQKKDLANWQKVLSATAYAALQRRVDEANGKTKSRPDADGFDVYRGHAMRDFVYRLRYEL